MAGSSDPLQELRGLVAGLPSGSRLVAALQATELSSSLITGLVVDVFREAKSQRPEGGAEERPRRSITDSALAVINDLTFIAPRGKQDVAFFPEHLLLKTAKADVVVPYAAIQHVAILDQIPRDTKGRVYLLLHLSQAVGLMVGKAALRTLAIQLTAEQQLSMAHPGGGEGPRLEGLAVVVLCQALGLMGLTPSTFCTPDADVFTSAAGAAGVDAHVKARQGVLFPLPAGLCFLETPALFIPRKAIRSVELARAGGASSTFDLYVHCADGTTHEFSTISRAEVGAMQAYLRAASLRIGPPGSDNEEEVGELDEPESDSDDTDDEDYNPDNADRDTGAGEEAAPKKRRRGAPDRGAALGAGGNKAARLEGGRGDEVGGEQGGDEPEQEDSEDEDSEDEDSEGEDSEGEDSVELVSEEEFSLGQLRSIMHVEREQGGGGPKRAPRREPPQ